MHENVKVWRRSAIEAAACLHRYNEIWNKGVVDAGDASRRGNAFHTAAELYIKELWAQQTEADIEIARDAFQLAVQRELLPAHLIPDTEMVFFRWAERFELKLDAYMHVEKTLYTQRRGRTFSWKPDLVYGTPKGVVIYDWKSHYAAWTPLQARHEFQGRMYLVMAADEWPNQPSYTMIFVFVRLGIRIEVTFGPEDIDQIERQIDGMLSVIEEADRTKKYPATPGPHCSFCRLDCPLNRQPALVPTRLDDVGEFSIAASEYLVATQRSAQLRELLTNYVVAEGPQDAHGMTFAMVPETTWRYPADQVLEVGDQYGLDLSTLTVSKAEIEEHVDATVYPEAAADLDQLRMGTKTTFKFRARRASLEGKRVR